MGWRAASLKIQSKGSITPKVTHRGELAARRAQTDSQYFTPDWVARAAWQLLAPFVDTMKGDHSKTISVIDTSCGAGALLGPADREGFGVCGVDIDEDCINALVDDAKAAEFYQTDFVVAGMEDIRLKGFDIAIINPPFSITLQSPHLQPYECTHYGIYGPNTSALSHEYAVAQALDGASIVAAVLPASMKDMASSNLRCRAIFDLPSDTFRTENANVSTILVIFGPLKRAVGDQIIMQAITEETDLSGYKLDIIPLTHSRPRIYVGTVEDDKPTITLPVTNDNMVSVHHKNRNIVLKFNCGFTQAKVMNGLLRHETIHSKGQRPSKNLPYSGSGRFLLDAHLTTDNPDASIAELLEDISALGGQPVLSPTFKNYWSKLQRKNEVATTPLRRWVARPANNNLTLTARHMCMLDFTDPHSPAVRKGEALQASLVNGHFEINYDGYKTAIRADQATEMFTWDEDPRTETQWEKIHDGRIVKLPGRARQVEARLDRAGIDWLWEFQRADIIEQALSPYGFVVAWEQGVGKARAALALAMISGKASMVVVDSGLLPEMLAEIEKIRLPGHLWKLIDNEDDCRELAQINITTYNALKRKVIRNDKRHHRKVVANALRRRLHTVICDEGSRLARPGTDQSRAIAKLMPKRVFVYDGTPQSGYPRDMVTVASAAAGQGRAHQPYGLHNNALVTPTLTSSANHQPRGYDAFREKHVVLEWCTNEFADDLRSGAKREVPKINNVVDFRKWLSPNVQRRVRAEPEVAPYVANITPQVEAINIDWDLAHYRHYKTISENFISWYTKLLEGHKGINLLSVLAKVGAVDHAANCPHTHRKNMPEFFMPVTSKQRRCIEEVETDIKDGRKVIVYAQSPEAINRLHRLADEAGIKSVRFTGQVAIKERAHSLYHDFRNGDANLLLSTRVGQRGLNIPEASAVYLYDRDWDYDSEAQAIARVLRPGQERDVKVRMLHLIGSIDVYKAQMVEWKRQTAIAGLDYGETISDAEDFHHLETIFGRFKNEYETLNEQILKAA